ncbi:unnamed protein product [Ambrosiozyma monospora]|uniref:Unnamed protein product n=1 Tax=Ambrosiozyma monospora TaxID=43982 RepID=A0A9W6YTS0_AMBMO|nr:unnamed protein product [Ambrosiozyma monospora]
MDSKTISKKENEVLSMFFDDSFVPHDYLDALFTSSLHISKQPSLQKTSNNEFSNTASLKSLQNKCSSLLTHLDYYTNELTREFEKNLNELQNSNSIISYTTTSASTSTTKKSGDILASPAMGHQRRKSSVYRLRSQGTGGIGDDGVVGVMRLEYYIENLSSSINSLNRDLIDVNKKIDMLKKQKKDDPYESQNGPSIPSTTADIKRTFTSKIDDDDVTTEAIKDLQRLLKVKNRIQKVLDACQTVKMLVDSGTKDVGTNNSKTDENTFLSANVINEGLAPTSDLNKGVSNNQTLIDTENFTFTIDDFQSALN